MRYRLGNFLKKISLKYFYSIIVLTFASLHCYFIYSLLELTCFHQQTSYFARNILSSNNQLFLNWQQLTFCAVFLYARHAYHFSVMCLQDENTCVLFEMNKNALLNPCFFVLFISYASWNTCVKISGTTFGMDFIF